MADLVVALPEPHPEDDEDVVWGLSTASALWARGERRDAVVWLKRAAEAAEAAGQPFRASELGLCITALEESLGYDPLRLSDSDIEDTISKNDGPRSDETTLRRSGFGSSLRLSADSIDVELFDPPASAPPAPYVPDLSAPAPAPSSPPHGYHVGSPAPRAPLPSPPAPQSQSRRSSSVPAAPHAPGPAPHAQAIPAPHAGPTPQHAPALHIDPQGGAMAFPQPAPPPLPSKPPAGLAQHLPPPTAALPAPPPAVPLPAPLPATALPAPPPSGRAQQITEPSAAVHLPQPNPPPAPPSARRSSVPPRLTPTPSAPYPASAPLPRPRSSAAASPSQAPRPGTGPRPSDTPPVGTISHPASAAHPPLPVPSAPPPMAAAIPKVPAHAPPLQPPAGPSTPLAQQDAASTFPSPSPSGPMIPPTAPMPSAHAGQAASSASPVPPPPASVPPPQAAPAMPIPPPPPSQPPGHAKVALPPGPPAPPSQRVGTPSTSPPARERDAASDRPGDPQVPPRGPKAAAASSAGATRRKPQPRAPILDPWSEDAESAAPPRPAQQIMTASGDAYLVARRTSSHDDEDDNEEVVTSAAPLDLALKRKPPPPPARTRVRAAATSNEQVEAKRIAPSNISPDESIDVDTDDDAVPPESERTGTFMAALADITSGEPIEPKAASATESNAEAPPRLEDAPHAAEPTKPTTDPAIGHDAAVVETSASVPAAPPPEHVAKAAPKPPLAIPRPPAPVAAAPRPAKPKTGAPSTAPPPPQPSAPASVGGEPETPPELGESPGQAPAPIEAAHALDDAELTDDSADLELEALPADSTPPSSASPQNASLPRQGEPVEPARELEEMADHVLDASPVPVDASPVPVDASPVPVDASPVPVDIDVAPRGKEGPPEAVLRGASSTVESADRTAPLETTASAAEPRAEPVKGPSSLSGSDLQDVDAFADLPEEMHDELARAARVDDLAENEELADFGAALVLQGKAAVCTTIVDTPAHRAVIKTLVPSRGSLVDGIPLRVVAGAEGARVAVWKQAVIDDALRTCPWVMDELRAVADRLQALAGATMGPLADLDEDQLARILGRLSLRGLQEGEPVVLAGNPMPGLIILGAGVLDLVDAQAEVLGSVRAGNLLFPAALLSGQPTPATARAARGGALILLGEHPVLRELFESTPELVAVLAQEE